MEGVECACIGGGRVCICIWKEWSVCACMGRGRMCVTEGVECVRMGRGRMCV